MAQHTWGRVKQDLLQAIGENNFNSWIGGLDLRGMRGSVAVFGVSTAFNGTWIERHYGEQILSTMRARGMSVSALEFVVDDRVAPTSANSAEVVPVAPAQAAPRALSAAAQRAEEVGAPLDSRFRQLNDHRHEDRDRKIRQRDRNCAGDFCLRGRDPSAPGQRLPH